jgi:hypothetical protein
MLEKGCAGRSGARTEKQAEIVVVWPRVSDAKQNALDWLKSRALVEQPSPEACSSVEYDLLRRMKMAPMGYCGKMRRWNYSTEVIRTMP